MSQNSCARTDIALKRGSRSRLKEQQTSSSHSNNNSNEQRQSQQQQHQPQQQQQQQQPPEIPSMPSLPSVPSSAAAAAAMMMMGLKPDDRNLSVCVSKKKQKQDITSDFFCFRNYPFPWIKDRHYFIHLVHRHRSHPSVLIMMHY